MSGYVLGALPFVCALAIAALNPTYLRPLYQDSLGQAIAVVGLLLWGAGGVWMRRLSQVDY
jgi:Flp pilus assembly protein TadB